MASAQTLTPKVSGHTPKPPAPQRPAAAPAPAAAIPRQLPAFARRASPKGTAGRPLDSALRTRFEARFQRDLSNVRVHPESPGPANAPVGNALAVTIGNDIYFARGRYAPSTDEGLQLIAHELTHVLQQESAEDRVTARTGSVQDRFESEAQRNAQAARSGGTLVVRERTQQAGPQPDEDEPGFFYRRLIGWFPQIKPILDRGVTNWIQDRVTDAAQTIVNVVMAPVRSVTAVAATLTSHFQSLVNWVKKAAASIAKGDCSVLHEAVDYIEEAVSGLISPIIDKIKEVGKKIGDFFSGLWDRFGAPVWNVMKKIGGWAWDRIQEFGTWIWEKTKPLRDWLARAWTWFKNLLGIGEGPEGQNGLLQWVEDKVEKAWNWLADKLEPIKKPLMVIGGILLLLSPAGPVIAVGAAVGGIIEGVRAIKRFFATHNGVVSARVILQTVVLPKLIQVIRGFAVFLAGKANSLLSVVRRARDTVREGARAAEDSIFSFLAGLLNWIADAIDDFAKWGDGVVADFLDWIARMTGGMAGFLQRILDALDEIAQVVRDIMRLPYLLMNKVWKAIPACIRDPFIDFFGIQILGRIAIFKAIAGTPEAWAKTKKDIADIIKTFFMDFDLTGAMKKAFLLMLRVLDVPLELLNSVINKLVQAWDIIKEKPIDFVKNLFRTIILSFKGFLKRILTHIWHGVVGWLTHSLKGSKLSWPSDWTDVGQVFSFVCSVMGLSLENIFKRMEGKVAPEKIAMLRKAVNVLTGAWEWISLILRGDFKGLWAKIQEKISDLWNMVMQGIVDWLVKQISIGIMEQLLTTADPTGICEVIMLIIDIYRTIKTVVQYMRQVLQMVDRMLDAIVNIATGILQPAADLIEGAMDQGMPVVIGFLANLFGLGDVGEAIGDVIDKIRDKVNVAIDWLIDKGLAFIDAVVGAVKSAVAAIKDWWKERFSTKVGDEKHTVLWQGEQEDAELSIESEIMPLRAFLDDLETKPGANKKVIKQIRTLLDEINTAKRQRGKTPDQIGGEIVPKVRQIVLLLPTAAASVTALPPTIIQVNDTVSVRGSTVGKRVLAAPLTLNPPTNGWTGSEPGEGNNFFKKVNQRKWTYIQGHLLNHNIHGPGIDQNLVPIHRKLNTGMVGPVENVIKTKVRDQHLVVGYDVTVQFAGWSPVFKHIPEENDLPTSMSFEAWEMKMKADQTDRTDPDNWERGASIPVSPSLPNYRGRDGNNIDEDPGSALQVLKRVNLNSRGKDIERAFEEVHYIGPEKASDLANSGRRFATLDAVAAYLHLPSDATDQWEKRKPPEVAVDGETIWE